MTETITLNRDERMKWVSSLKVGDKVIRMLAMTIPQELEIAKIEKGFVFLRVPGTTSEDEGNFWVFDQLGVEYDPDIPVTVSIIKPL